MQRSSTSPPPRPASECQQYYRLGPGLCCPALLCREPSGQGLHCIEVIAKKHCTEAAVLLLSLTVTLRKCRHGHAKCHFVATDIFTGKKLEDLQPSSHNSEVRTSGRARPAARKR